MLHLCASKKPHHPRTQRWWQLLTTTQLLFWRPHTVLSLHLRVHQLHSWLTRSLQLDFTTNLHIHIEYTNSYRNTCQTHSRVHKRETARTPNNKTASLHFTTHKHSSATLRTKNALQLSAPQAKPVYIRYSSIQYKYMQRYFFNYVYWYIK